MNIKPLIQLCYPIAVAGLLCINPGSLHAGEVTVTPTSTSTANTNVSDGSPNPISIPGIEQLVQSLNNLGAYMGFDLTVKGESVQQITLLPTTLGSNLPMLATTLFLGTLIEKSLVDVRAQNKLAELNNRMTVYPPNSYSNVGGAANTLSVSPVIDQKPFMNDPVSQNIVDMLSTYDPSFCPFFAGLLSSSSSRQASLFPNGKPAVFDNCYRVNQSTVANQVLNPQPNNALGGLSYLFLPTNAPNDPQLNIIPQLNSNSLIEPLLYSIESKNPSLAQNPNIFTAINQAQQAANFIRYVSSAVAPPTQISLENFQNLSAKLTSPTEDIRTQAQAQLASYFANMRSYAALISVGTANLNSMLSKRMPQVVQGTTENCVPSSTNNCSTNTITSEALTDYLMATRRIADPQHESKWRQEINTATSATVQKEMAILLSEINYQLYLTRQQQERILLTNSMIMFQVSRLVAPTAPTQPNQ